MARKKGLALGLLGGAALVLALALLLLRRAAPAAEPAPEPLCPLAAADIGRLTYTFEGDTVALTKNDAGDWTLTDDPALPLAQGTVRQMVDDMAALTPTSTLGPEADIAAMGFDAPKAEITLETGNASFSLTIGAVNVMTGSYYLRTGEGDTVYTAASADVSALCRSRRGLYAAQTLNDLDAEALTAMTVQTGAETLEFVRKDDAWQLASDPDFALDQDKVQRMANTACGLQTAWTVTAPAEPAAYGLDAPDVTVTVTDGESSWTAYFGADAGTDAGTCYLTADDASGLVYEVLTQHKDAFAYTKTALAAP